MRKEHLFTLMIVLLPMLQAEWHYRHPLPLPLSLTEPSMVRILQLQKYTTYTS